MSSNDHVGFLTVAVMAAILMSGAFLFVSDESDAMTYNETCDNMPLGNYTVEVGQSLEIDLVPYMNQYDPHQSSRGPFKVESMELQDSNLPDWVSLDYKTTSGNVDKYDSTEAKLVLNPTEASDGDYSFNLYLKGRTVHIFNINFNSNIHITSTAVKEIHVAYDAAGGECDKTNDTVPEGEAITLPSASLDDQHMFDGWYDGDVRVGGAGDAFVPTKDVKLTAKYNQIVTIDSRGGRDATVGYEYVYNVQTTPSDAMVSVSGADWLAVNGHRISGTPSSPGSVTVTVTAYKDGHGSSTETFVILIAEESQSEGAPVISDLRYDVDSRDPFRITVSVSASDASSISVDYGDGTSGTGAQSTHTYSASGSYTVRASATNSSGTVSKTVTILIADKSPGTSVMYNNEYSYTLGIDTSGHTPSVAGAPFLQIEVGSNYVKVFGIPNSTSYVGQTYDVRLTVGDFVQTWRLSVVSGSTSPIPGFDVSKIDGLTITVSGTAQHADSVFYQWTVGGQWVPSNSKTVSHTYDEAGVYTITQRVTSVIDGQTITMEWSKTVEITGSGSPGDDIGEEDGGSDATGLIGIVALVAGAALAIVGLAIGNTYAIAAGAVFAVVGLIARFVI